MPFTNILVNTPAMPSNRAEAAIEAVVRLATPMTKITVFDVASNLSWIQQYLTAGWEEAFQDLSGAKRRQLKKHADGLVERGLDATCIEGDGRLSAAIIQQVNAQRHDLVIKVAEDKSINRSGIVGSTDMRLIHSCPCSVLVIRPDAEPGFNNAAVALDILDQHQKQRDLDQQALTTAAEIVAGDAGALAAIYALPRMEQMVTITDESQGVLTDEQVDRWNDELYRAAEKQLVEIADNVDAMPMSKQILHGQPEVAIPEYVESQSVDLLVVGSVPREGLDGWLIGSTAERILERVSCSVLALKPTA